MNYKTLLKNVAENGHGVFIIPMVQDKKARWALEKWIYRNQVGPNPLVRTFIGGNLYRGIKGHGDLKICVLTQTGVEKFCRNSKATKAQGISSLVDMALINAYMSETNEWKKYSYRPKLTIEIGGKKIGVISNSWYFSEPALKVDLFLSTRWTRKIRINDNYIIDQVALRNNCTIEKVLRNLRQTYTPVAFKSARRFM
ncbi:MAG: hypothetical protein KC478_10660 [Bacteriovoracaceae bacterium]|nr:hypothetical protein [Bacteriovoracaceae bacterium]